MKDSELQLFCKEAKKYGVLYCVLKDKDANDGLTDIYTHLDYSNKVSSANAILGVYPNTFRVGAVGQ